MDFEMAATIDDNFTLPIDQSHLDRLPDLDDFDDDSDSESEAEYSYGDDDDDDSFSLSLGDGDDEDCDEGYGSSLWTIIEETDEDLTSVCSDENDSNEDSDLYYQIQMPRQVSLHAYLAKDGRRNEANNIDVTYHRSQENLDSDESESTHAEENLLRKSASMESFASQDDDTKSIDSNSSGESSSFRLAQRRLQKELCLRKLKQAVQAADLTSSFRKNEAKTSKCINSIERTLLQSPEKSRSFDGYQIAKNNLLNAISSSQSVLSMSKE